MCDVQNKNGLQLRTYGLQLQFISRHREHPGDLPPKTVPCQGSRE